MHFLTGRRSITYPAAFALSAASLWACGDPVSTDQGATIISLLRSPDDPSPYTEQHADSVVVKQGKHEFSVNWLDCVFKAERHGSGATNLEPTHCPFRLQDGRAGTLVIGPVPDGTARPGTHSALLFPGSQLSIEVVGAVVVDGVYYDPAYFSFHTGSADAAMGDTGAGPFGRSH